MTNTHNMYIQNIFKLFLILYFTLNTQSLTQLTLNVQFQMVVIKLAYLEERHRCVV